MKLTEEEIEKKIADHQHFLNKDVKSWHDMRADFSGVELYGYSFKGKDLRQAFFNGVNFSRCNFSGADLRDANFYGANLLYADFSEAILTGARFNGADLSWAIFDRANASACFCGARLFNTCFLCTKANYADFRGAKLSFSYIENTDLYGTKFMGADLNSADVFVKDFSNINVRGAHIGSGLLKGENLDCAFPLACPEEGPFIGWKKASGKIIKLEIPENAKRSSAYGRKCRCNKAKVLVIQELDGQDSGLVEIESDHDKNFIYKIGETVKVDDFCEDRWEECSAGIHFFITRNEAVNY